MSFRLCRFPTQKIRLSTRNVRSQSAPEPSEPFHKPTNAGLATPRQVRSIRLISVLYLMLYSARRVPRSVCCRSSNGEKGSFGGVRTSTKPRRSSLTSLNRVFNHYNRVRANMFFSGMESRDSLSPARTFKSFEQLHTPQIIRPGLCTTSQLPPAEEGQQS